MPTFQESVVKAKDKLSGSSSSARLDAELLLAFACGLSRVQLISKSQDILPPAAEKKFFELVDQRSKCIPIAYLTGHHEFFALDFEVTPAVLVPRPETENLVEEAFNRLSELSSSSPRVIDLGTGSGCVIISLLHECHKKKKQITAFASDKSFAALEVATRNAQRLVPEEKVTWIESDWWQGLPAEQSVFEMIVTNPPYIAEGDPEVSPDIAHEPASALYSGSDGLQDIKRLLVDIPAHLEPGGFFISEMGSSQKVALRELVASLPQLNGWPLEFYTDLAGLTRGFILARPA